MKELLTVENVLRAIQVATSRVNARVERALVENDQNNLAFIAEDALTVNNLSQALSLLSAMKSNLQESDCEYCAMQIEKHLALASYGDVELAQVLGLLPDDEEDD